MIQDVLLTWILIQFKAPIWTYALIATDVCIRLLNFGIKMGEQNK